MAANLTCARDMPAVFAIAAVITKNVVAMGFPSEGTEGIYRNHMRDVKK